MSLWIYREFILSLQCNLIMSGIPLEGPAQVFFDRPGIVKNVSIPESVLSTKLNAISNQAVCEAAASELLQVFKKNTMANLAALFNKVFQIANHHDVLGSIMDNF